MLPVLCANMVAERESRLGCPLPSKRWLDSPTTGVLTEFPTLSWVWLTFTIPEVVFVVASVAKRVVPFIGLVPVRSHVTTRPAF